MLAPTAFRGLSARLRSSSAGVFRSSMLSTIALVTLAACGATTRTETPGTGGEGGETWTAGPGVGGAGGSGGIGAGGSGVGAGPSELQSLEHIDLGDVALNMLQPFEVPDRALGLTVTVGAANLNDVVGISRLRPPTGDPVIFNYAMAGKNTPAFASYGWVGGANPQSDASNAWPMQQGQWRIALGDDDGSLESAHVDVWIRRTKDGLFHGGVVDVNVFLAPNSTTQNYVNQVLSEMFVDYAGLGLGNVTFLPLDASFTNVGTYNEYRSLLASSAGLAHGPALNLFVIGSFGSEFGQAIGVAGGIPGSPVLQGTTMSGVAYMPSGNPEYDASVLRHEVGHLAGLFHTTEFSVEETDPLSDTVECPTSVMQSNPDNCPDVSNTMFPIAYGALALTEAQKRVLHGSALYRGILEEGGQPAPADPAPIGGKFAPPLPPSPPFALAATRRPNKPFPANPTPLERVLGAVWCAHGKGDYEALALRIAGASAPSTLRALVLDDKASELFRARALGAYVRVSQGDERTRAVKLAETLATRETTSTDLRVSALRSLARFAPSEARQSAAIAAQSEDPVVRAVAWTLRGK
ncbi:hypothetical protein E8A74_16410 [Polyangium fumosum]|uniref:Peptidase M43 pregnancy-associated plasma-A domain-containing protein n=2 Tax=Polyangium fumosum TaxID=889272 RepID=A0A4V5PPS0_9BACT|nr:hypothetical protein E8A74_16410 [Polyangium fumosum]